MRRVFLLLVICITSHAMLVALDIQWQFLGGVKYIANTDERNSDPSPIAGTMGVEVFVPVKADTQDSGLFAVPELSLFYTRYLWAEDRALPAAIENRTAIVPAIHLDIPLVYKMPVGQVVFRFGAGIGMLLRWGFRESGVPAEDYDDVGEINSYLWRGGRFLYPSIQAGVSYPMKQGIEPGFLLKCGLPISNLWTEPSVPFVDAMIVSVLFTIKIK